MSFWNENSYAPILNKINHDAYESKQWYKIVLIIRGHRSIISMYPRNSLDFVHARSLVNS